LIEIVQVQQNWSNNNNETKQNKSQPNTLEIKMHTYRVTTLQIRWNSLTIPTIRNTPDYFSL